MLKTNISNEEAVLNFIRRYGPISKAMIARQTGITAPTVTNVCNNLIQKGLIEEIGQEKIALGRPSMLLRFRGNYEKYLIIHVRTQKIHFYITDSSANVELLHIVSSIGKSGEEIMDILHTWIESILEQNQVKAIGFILRGPVDSKEGISVYSPHAKWSNVPFKYIFEERYHLPVYIENDMHALTTGEYYYGKGRNIRNLVVIKLSYGLGVSLMINGSLYRGFSDGAGELGHAVLAVNDNKYVPLEDVGSETSMRNYVIEAIEKGESSILEGNKDIFNNDFKVTPIYKAAVHGDKVALEAIKRAGKYLGIAIANLINLLNPEKIVISCDMLEASVIMDDILHEAINKYSYRVHPIQLSYSSKGYELILQGMIDIMCTERAPKLWLI